MFIRRFSLHILPSGLARIRHYGILGNNRRKRDIEATWLELKQFTDLDSIHEDETAAGYYSFPSVDSEATIKSEGEIASAWKNARAAIGDFLFSSQGKLTSTELRQLLEAARKLNPATQSNADIADAQDKWTTHSFQLTADTYSVQGEWNTYQQMASEYRCEAANKKANYDRLDIDFRRRRTEAARRINAIKSIAYTEPGGAFNYKERMLPIQARFEADFNDAMLRLASVREGLSAIYGYDLSLKASDTPFDDALLAVRAALEWLVRFSGQEQNYILPVSIKALTGGEWQAGLNASNTGGSWNFKIGRELFPDQSHVRLRGLSATVATDNPNAIFQAIIQVPQKASVIFLEDSSSPKPLEQGNVPPIRIGRIHQLNGVRAPDVVGTLTLHNVSPICFNDNSSWRLVITSRQMPPILASDSREIPPNEPAISVSDAKLKDVYLHLLLAVRSVRRNA